MASLEEIRDARIKKLELLKARGINPYPADSKRELSLAEVLSNFEALELTHATKWISGRVMAIRGQGAIMFVTLNDGSGKLQGVLKEDVLQNMDLFKDVVDIGDFIEIRGTFFVTQRGEKSLLASEWRMLTKSLSPLPEKWHGLTDNDERFRKRYLDILMDDELKDLFIKKSKFWDATRTFLKAEGFLEIETPTLEVTTGGAEARPFLTHHNDFDLAVYMRISVGELWQKRLMAAGFPKTFEIGRVYRNEGSSPEHTQEFTNMEFYAAYLNFEDGKELVKRLYRTVAENVFGTTKFETRGHSFDLNNEWKELDYVSTIKEMTGVDVLEDEESVLEQKLKELGVKFDGNNRERMTDSLWKYCRKSISGPAFLVNHPKLVAPLSKEHPDNPKATKTFQVILAGSEIGRAHAELNDPIDQLERFNKQKELIEGGDDEAMMADHEFVEMLEYGMPPTFGFGFGERFFAFLVDKPLRETQLFPLMRPKN